MRRRTPAMPRTSRAPIPGLALAPGLALITRLALTLALAFGSALAPTPAQAQSGTSYIYLIDTSGSMEGLPAGSGNAVIFPRVKEELLRHLAEMEAGEQVEILTFDEGVQVRAVFDMASPDQRQEAARFVEGLEAQGQSTWVYRSILDAARDRRAGSDAASPAVFYVFTDGVDNDPEGASMREMLEAFGELRHENDYLVYVTLGVDLPASDSTAFEEHDWGHLRKQPSGVLRLDVVQVRPPHLNFGYVGDDLSDSRSLVLRSTGADSGVVRMRIVASFPEIGEAGGVVQVESTTTDDDTSVQIHLRIVNRESVPEGVFTGEFQLHADQPHVQLLPDRLTATFSTVQLPKATVGVGEAGIDFGEWRIGDEELPEARIDVGFDARSEEAGFYVEVTSDSITPVVPTVAWNGQPVGEEQLLTSTERGNELVFSWSEAPTEDGLLTGEVRLEPEDLQFELQLQGAGLSPNVTGNLVVPWRLQVRPAPLPWWQLALYWLLALVVLLFVLMCVLGVVYGGSPFAGTRLFLVSLGAADPRLHGKLVYQPPGQGSQEVQVPLSGSRTVRVGADSEHLPELPDQVEFSARYRDKKERVVARCTYGNVERRPDGEYDTQPLGGQVLERFDVLVMSDKTEMTFIDG